MKYPPLIARYASIAAIGVLMTACGGGGGGGGTTQSNLDIAVHDGPIQGVRVFLDLDGDLEHDSNEPISTKATDPDGKTSIDISGISAAQLASSYLVASIPDDAKDVDDLGKTMKEAKRSGLTFVSPAAALVSGGEISKSKAYITPISTEVAILMLGDDETPPQTLSAARVEVSTSNGLTTEDPLGPVESDHMKSVARLKANTNAVALETVGKTANANGQNLTLREKLQVAVRDGKDLYANIKDTAEGADALSTVLNDSPEELVAKLDSANIKHNNERTLKLRNQARMKDLGTFDGPQTFIVVLQPGSAAQRDALITNDVLARGGKVNATFNKVFSGFSVNIPAQAKDAFADAMGHNPNVKLVESEQYLKRHASSPRSATGLWGLDIIDSLIDTQYTFSSQGNGISVFVVDTGIRSDHTEFGSPTRVLSGTNTVGGTSSEDDQGHGTHVAGTVGGLNYGVSSEVTLVPVKVLDATGSGSLTSVIKGLDWIANYVVDNALTHHAVVNMSLGGGASSTLDLAAANLVAQGIPVVVAAGNENIDACNTSPAREPSVITVGAASFDGSNITRAYYSNYGPCVDLFAPGSAIKSSTIESTISTGTWSGTSMASPHVTGWVAQLLEFADTTSTTITSAATVNGWVADSAISNLLTSAGTGSPNLFLHVGSGIPTLAVSPAPTDVHIAALSGGAQRHKGGWAAIATITVKDSSGGLVDGARVAGDFTLGGVSREVNCTTTNGVCQARYNDLTQSDTSITFEPTNITGNVNYVSGSNEVSPLTVTISAPTKFNKKK